MNIFFSIATESLVEPTSTGLAYRSSTSTFYLLDWKSKFITEFTITNQININHQITCPLFNEPVQIALFEQRVSKLNPIDLTSKGYSCFKLYFERCNFEYGNSSRNLIYNSNPST